MNFNLYVDPYLTSLFCKIGSKIDSIFSWTFSNKTGIPFVIVASSKLYSLLNDSNGLITFKSLTASNFFTQVLAWV